MIIYSSDFPGIDDALKEARMTRKELAKESNIKYDTLGYKLRSETQFTLDEMFAIKAVFDVKLSKCFSLEHLFTPVGKDEKRAS